MRKPTQIYLLNFKQIVFIQDRNSLPQTANEAEPTSIILFSSDENAKRLSRCLLVASRWWALPPSGGCWARWSLCSALASHRHDAETDGERAVLGMTGTEWKLHLTTLIDFHIDLQSQSKQHSTCIPVFKVQYSDSQHWAHLQWLVYVQLHY